MESERINTCIYEKIAIEIKICKFKDISKLMTGQTDQQNYH